MDLLMFLIAVIGITVSIASKKSKAAQAPKRRGSPEADEPFPGAAPGHSPQDRSASSKASKAAKPAVPSASKTSKWPQPGAAQPQKKAAGSAYGGTPRYTHVVTSTLEGGHTHTESSMTGEEACPPPKPASAKPQTVPAAAAAAGEPLLDLNANSVLQGILYAEILGKPKALQRK